MIYGTYGKSNLLNTNFRTAKGGHNTDFITVGKIDNSYYGKYAESKKLSFGNILLSFHYKSESEKWKVLIDLFEKEKDLLKINLKEWLVNRNDVPIVEITNEPNLFPYISPSLYAKYYKLWYDEIKSICPNSKIMNGGLWINEGLPKSIINQLKLMNITQTNTLKYYKDVFEILDNSYKPDILNLHFYPYIGDYRQFHTIQHINFLKELIKTIGIQDVWLTEFGNINSISMRHTKILMDILLYETSKIEEIKRIYYFKVSEYDKKFDLLIQIHNQFIKNKNLFNKLFSGVKYLFKKKPEFFNIAKSYIENPPIQALEGNGKLNEVGELYKMYIESSKD